MERKKISLIITGIFIFVLSFIGVTYAFWQLRLFQNSEDTIASSCFDVQLEKEGSAIQLEKAYPMKDDERKELTPYTFTITNKCSKNASYQINLEALEKYGDITLTAEQRLTADYIRAQLNEIITEEEVEKDIVSLTRDIHVEPTLKDETAKSYDSFKLATGYLGPSDSKTFALRIWLAETAEEEAMDKVFASKITVTTSYILAEKVPPTVDLELAVCEKTITAKGKGVSSEGKEITSYEFKLDEEEDWSSNEGNSTKTFPVENGSHTVSLKVTDSKGYSSEITKNIEVFYEEPTAVNIGGRTINLVTEGNGLYKVGHCEASGTTDDQGFNQEEYRYAGKNYVFESNPTDYVYNYISIDDELWRIIGLVNVKTSSGKIEQRLKIIKNLPLGSDELTFELTGYNYEINTYIWNTEERGNDWTNSTLMAMLNGIYYDNSNGECYETESSSTCDFTQNGLKATLKNMIDQEISWNIGGVRDEELYLKQYYEQERSTQGGFTSPTIYEWNSRNTNGATFHSIGLMYPSEVGVHICSQISEL